VCGEDQNKLGKQRPPPSCWGSMGLVSLFLRRNGAICKIVMHSIYMFMLVYACCWSSKCVCVRRLLGVVGRECSRAASGANSWPPPHCPIHQGEELKDICLSIQNLNNKSTSDCPFIFYYHQGHNCFLSALAHALSASLLLQGPGQINKA